MSDEPPPIVPIRMKRPRWDQVVPGSTPRGGFTCYRGSGMLNSGGKVWVQWIPIIYEDDDEPPSA